MPPEEFEIPETVCRGLKGVFFDIDDTFTFEGKIRPEAFSALWEARQAGLLLVPITGRPAGWADHIARMWPVDGVVGENGAFYFRLDPVQGRLRRRFVVTDPEARRQVRTRLMEIYQEVQNRYPRVRLASDQPYRECDLAVDFREDVSPPLSWEDARGIQSIFESRGANAKISSIHVNAWFGDYDKLTMCEILLREEYGIRLDQEKERFFYCGDSPNDCPMFAYFPHSAGVSGVRRFQEAGLMTHLPRTIASRDGSFGFQDILGRIIGSRRG